MPDSEPCSLTQHYFSAIERSTTESGDMVLYQHCVYCGLFIEEPLSKTPVASVFREDTETHDA